MKKLIALICALFAAGTALAASEAEPVYGKDIKDGVYKIEVESSSSMFRVTDCELSVKDGEMTAVLTLGGTGYEKLFMGGGEEAASAPDSEFAYFKENDRGEYTYSVPVAALNADVPCAAFSIRRQRWYDRTLVFKADSLPKGAVASGASLPLIFAAAVLAALAIIAVVIVKKRRAKNEG